MFQRLIKLCLIAIIVLSVFSSTSVFTACRAGVPSGSVLGHSYFNEGDDFYSSSGSCYNVDISLLGRDVRPAFSFDREAISQNQTNLREELTANDAFFSDLSEKSSSSELAYVSFHIQKPQLSTVVKIE